MPNRDTSMYHVAAEQVPSLLHMAALVSAADWLPALPATVAQLAARFSPAQQDTNALLFGPLAGALHLDEPPDDWAGYREAFAAQPAERTRANAAAQLGQTWLLDAPPPSNALLGAARALLQRPAELHALVTAHLHALWQGVAEHWPPLEREHARAVATLREHMLDAAGDTLHNLAAYVAHAPVPPGIERIIFVPSPLVGRYVSRVRTGTTLRLFFHLPRFAAAVLRATPMDMPELVGRLGALHDETRLRIIQLFATRDKLQAHEIMDELALSQSSTSRSLNQLSPFLQVGRAGDGKKVYTLLPAQFDLTTNAVKQLLHAPRSAAAPPADPAPDHAPALQRFLDEHERVTTWPAKQKDRLLVLQYLVSKFEPDTTYTEKEVNAIITRYHAYGDPATLRRELFGYGMLRRTLDGAQYWLAEATPSHAEEQQ